MDISVFRKSKGRLIAVAGCLATGAMAYTVPAQAMKFEVNGDMNNRFQLATDKRSWFGGGVGLAGKRGALVKNDGDDAFAEIKYRFTLKGQNDEGTVKGVYGVEIGGVRAGQSGGGTFSGDGKNVETRFAYVDFSLPESPAHRVKVGLQPVSVNKYIWQESAIGVVMNGPLSDTSTYQLLWARGDAADETGVVVDGYDGADNFAVNVNFQPSSALKGGAFVLYQTNNQIDGASASDVTRYEIKGIADNSSYDIVNVGLSGQYNSALNSGGKLFAKGVAIYQKGDIELAGLTSLDGSTNANTDYDLSAYFLRGDIGVDYGDTKWTYTVWYASGDDNDSDSDLDAYMATDVDMNDSAIFQENMTDDDYFAETPYLVNKGMLVNKIQVDHKLSSRTTITGMALYNMLAEDILLGDGSFDDKLGLELGARVSYKLHKGLKLQGEVAYLFADDAMDAFEETSIQDGNGNEDIFHVAARLRYNF
ncbi:MAG: hypothetical protein OQK12_12600 [Motiliproteus sp.]|nr:hypothetical protein [Motiliproteus sp.]MCW9051611.1 hypothetical protein [Motiliproteus sp.]